VKSGWSNCQFLQGPLYGLQQTRQVRHWARKGAPPDTIRALPNRKTRANEYRIGTVSSGVYSLLPPYPPRVNRTIKPYPANNPHKNDREYLLRWKHIEYKFQPKLLPKPWKYTGAWGGSIIRIDHNFTRRQ